MFFFLIFKFYNDSTYPKKKEQNMKEMNRNYEAPVIEILAVRVESALLNVSGVDAVRNGYDSTEGQEWE